MYILIIHKYLLVCFANPSTSTTYNYNNLIFNRLNVVNYIETRRSIYIYNTYNLIRLIQISPFEFQFKNDGNRVRLTFI